MTSRDEIFVSSIRSRGDLGGVFEFDGDVAYFYLYNLASSEGKRVVSSIHITDEVDFSEEDIAVQWSRTTMLVGLLIHNYLWAVFDTSTGDRFGGGYERDKAPQMPQSVLLEFSQTI